MLDKKQLRKKYYEVRKKRYFKINDSFFKPLIRLLSNLFKKKLLYLSFYYPSNYEVNVLNLFKLVKKKTNTKVLLPVINSRDKLTFVQWNFLDILKVNKYGILEPAIKTRSLVPNVVLVPLLAFDKNNYINIYNIFISIIFKMIFTYKYIINISVFIRKSP